MKKLRESVRTSMQAGRRTLAVLIAAAVLLCTLPTVSVSAANANDTFIDNGIKYQVTSTTEGSEQVEVEYNSSSPYSGTITIPDSVTSNGVPYSVAQIGNSAFISCSGLTAVTIPSSVTAIGDFAFNGCSALTSLNFEQNSNLTTIGDNVFNNIGITTITIPVNLSSIPSTVFSSCPKLSEIKVDSGNQNYCAVDGVLFSRDEKTLISYPAAKEGTYTIPSGTTTINTFGFARCTKLTGLTVPASVQTVGVCGFAGDTILTNVTFWGESPTFGASNFSNCPALTDIAFYGSTPPASVGFSGYTTPVKIHVPDGETSVYTSVFQSEVNANQVTIIAMPPAEKVGDQFTANNSDGVPINYVVINTNPKQVKVVAKVYSGNITIPADAVCASDGQDYAVTEIGSGAFLADNKVTSVSLPSSLTTIANNAFTGSSVKGTITVPDGVTSIGNQAFTGCPLTSIVLPRSVASIGKNAFAGCIYLSITLDPGNSNFSMEDGVLFNKEKTSLVAFPGGKTGSEYTVPSGVTSIANGAFYVTGLKKITLPSGVASIGDQTFAFCRSLTDLTCQGEAPQTVGNNLFQGDTTPITVHVPANEKPNYETAFSAYLPSQLTFDAVALPSLSAGSSSPQTTSTQVDTTTNTATVTTVPDSVTYNGGTAQISATVPSVTNGAGGSLDTGKAGKVTISLPTSTILQQLGAKQNVDLTLSVPSSVAQQTNSKTSVDIPVGSNVFAAAKAGGSDLVINIKDTDTQKLAYIWTFRGDDLAKSTTPVTDVNIGMAIRLTTEVPQVQRLTPKNTGLVLMFDHSGTLPSTASLTFNAKEKGFQPGQKLYFYFYNTTTGQLESQAQEYTVDADGNLTVRVSHCSNYVLLPNKARTITLDTRSYNMSIGGSYITGVKLTGITGTKIKAYSSTKGVADVTVLSNGNVTAKARKNGLTYVMMDVYDSKNKFLTHASIRLLVKKVEKPYGNSARQFGIF